MDDQEILAGYLRALIAEVDTLKGAILRIVSLDGRMTAFDAGQLAAYRRVIALLYRRLSDDAAADRYRNE